MAEGKQYYDNAPFYRYEHLKDPTSDLRLIGIDSAPDTDVVRCILRTYSAQECPSYEALSYAWGDDAQKSTIVMSGGRGDALFEVTLNLESALLNLRKRQTGQTTDLQMFIWIDALCIDQTNLEERNIQVQRMRSIYRNARRVVVYLGDYKEPTDRSIVFSREIWGMDSLEQGSYSLTLAAVTIALHLSSATRVASAE